MHVARLQKEKITAVPTYNPLSDHAVLPFAARVQRVGAYSEECGAAGDGGLGARVRIEEQWNGKGITYSQDR